MNTTPLSRLPIDAIVIGKRFRCDYSGVGALAASISAVGLLQPPGVTPGGRLLWGECRLRACRSLGWTEIPVLVRDVDTADFVAIEAAENFARKDFTLSEAVAIKRAIEPQLKAEAAERQRAGTVVQSLHKGKTREQTAALTGFSHTTLRKAEEVVAAAEADPDRFGKLRQEMDRHGKADAVYRRLNNIRQSDLIRAAPPPLPSGPFGVISIDVPWPYEIRDVEPSHRGVMPYPTMTVDDIEALPVRTLAADDAVLWMWITNFHLVLGTHVRLLDAWGFNGRSLLTWAQPSFGFGNRLRGQTEQCIYAVRGEPVVKTHHGQSTLLEAPARDHSEKPDEFYALVESLCPAPPGGYLEMFARKQRPGWVTWGDEVPG